MIKGMYTIFLGILIALFVGVGITAFYTAPKAPVPFPYPQSPDVQPASTPAEIMKQQEALQKQQELYVTQTQLYNRNVSLIALISAVVLLTASLLFAKYLAIFADGLLLGSSLTLIYSIFRGFAAHDDMYRFLIVSVSLVLVLFIGYIKFLKQQK